jgi:hypothetical protein
VDDEAGDGAERGVVGLDAVLVRGADEAVEAGAARRVVLDGVDSPAIDETGAQAASRAATALRVASASSWRRPQTNWTERSD